MPAPDAPAAAASRRTDTPAPLTNVVAVLGPTNTGKTHYAVERMLAHESGMIGLPLRLLAREVYDRIIQIRAPSSVALITGEEKIVPENPSYWVCTVEAMPLDRRVAFLAVDEIQLCSDPERGHTFTSRLLHARGQLETLFLGAATMRSVIRELLPGIQFMQRTRLSQLSYSGERKVSRLPRRSAIVAFSADQVYGIAELIRRQRGGAAVVMGALSPRTRNAQVALYQSGEVDFIVATDAIGMGLNMDIDHVAFSARRKFDGNGFRDLKAHEIGQIAGRAGRYMNDGTFGVSGDCVPFDAEMIDQIENHRFDPVRLLQWRNDELDFASMSALIASLEVPPETRGLLRAKPAVDLVSLKAMSANLEVESRTKDEGRTRLLWSVCQIPDFQQTFIDEHVRLLTNVFVHLTDNDGRLPEDWIAGHVARLDNTEGDIDALQARLAYVRTWTFISNRGQWLNNAEHWRERAQAIEDKLSDALHEQLTQRFVDRRTSVLMRRLSQDDILDVMVDDDGEIAIEKEYIGRLSGLRFMLDPRAAETKGALEAKALRGAATKALEPFVYRTAARLRAADKREIALKDAGFLVFEGHPIARLKTGPSPLKPRVELLTSEMIADLLGAEGRQSLVMLLEIWVERHIAEILPGLLALKKAVEAEGEAPADGPIPLGAERKTVLNGLARGIGYQLLEHFGLLARASVAEQIKALTAEDRAGLRNLGVRFGEFSIYMPGLLKPAQARLLVILWGVHSGHALTPEGLPAPPPAGLTSAPMDPAWSDAFLAAAGYRRCGARAVRVDILERIGNLIRKQRFPEPPPKPGPIVERKGEGLALPVSPPLPIQPEPATEPAAGEATVEIGADTPPAPETTPVAAATEPQPPDAPAPPLLRPGSFVATPEMLSLAGCSTLDFDEVLKSLGYRKITAKAPDGTDLMFWRVQRPREERPQHQGKRDGGQQRRPRQRESKAPQPAASEVKRPSEQRQPPHHRPKPDSQRHEGKGGKPPAQERPRQHPQRSEHRSQQQRGGTFDKDSPFAVLAELKAKLSQK